MLAGWHMSNRPKAECQASGKHCHGSVPASLGTGHVRPGRCPPAGLRGWMSPSKVNRKNKVTLMVLNPYALLMRRIYVL